AYETKDRQAIESILADDFTFTSPNNDDHIDRAAYFEKCWAGADLIRGYQILNLFEQGNEAFIRYICELKDGKRFQNTEYFRIEGDKIREVEVYFGANI